MRTLGALVAVVLAPAVCGQPAEPVPDPRPALAPIRELRTWYRAVGGGVVRVDTLGPMITVDLDGLRFHYDGVDLWRQEVRPAGPAPDPVRLPEPVAARVREVWDEARAGFPSTTFRPETPAAVAPGWQPDPHQDDRWYRVDLPFAWDDEAAVHIGLRGGPQGYRLAWVSVRSASTGEPLFRYEGRPRGHSRVPRRFDSGAVGVTLYPTPFSLIDVPLGPDAYRPSYAGPDPVRYDLALGGEPYHEAVRRLAFEYDEDASSGRTTGGTPVAALSIGPRRCEPDRRVALEGLVRWTVPDDPASLERARTALATCSSVRLRAQARACLRPQAGATGCVTGSWDVVSLATSPPTVLWSQPVSTCAPGVTYPAHDVILPPDTDVGALAVQFEGRVELECSSAPGDGLREVTFDTRGPLPPVIAWDCWPGWRP